MYTLTCLQCQQEGISAHYIGESGRSGHQRGTDHLRGAKKRDPKNPMVRHGEDHHHMFQGIPPFKMEMTRSFLKPLQRQIAEAVTIERGANNADLMLNSKAEWGHSKIPRLTVEVGPKVAQADFRGRTQDSRRLDNDW